MIDATEWGRRMPGLRVLEPRGRRWQAATRVIAGAVLVALVVVGIRASAPTAAGAAASDQVILRLWPAGQGRIEATQGGSLVASCDFVAVVQTDAPCEVPVTVGAPLTLTAIAEPGVPRPDAALLPDFPAPQPSFVRWTVGGCEGTGPCTLIPTGDSDWVGAIFTPLQLEVGVAGTGTVGVLGANGGVDALNCTQGSFGDTTCHALEPADASLVLVASGDQPIAWGAGCDRDAGNPARCTVTMSNLTTFASVAMGAFSSAPNFPYLLVPHVRVVLAGTGQGHVTGSGFDCGSVCGTDPIYQDRVTLTATPDAGSHFVGWKGACSTTPVCSFIAGATTLVQAVFDVATSTTVTLPPPPPPSIGTPITSGKAKSVAITSFSSRFAIQWKQSRVRGDLVVSGSAPSAGTYVVTLTKDKKTKVRASLKLKAGKFSRKLDLPAKLLPGTYRVALLPPGSKVAAASRSLTLAAPPEGVVDAAFMSGARDGTAARTLTGITTIWANFHFAALPNGQLTVTWYRLGKTPVRLGSTTKARTAKIISFLTLAKPAGSYQAVLSRKNVVIAQASVKVG